MYPLLILTPPGGPLTGASSYTPTFLADQLPPVNAFWSLTMYRLPESLLVENPINRYLINSPMLPNLVKNPDGGLTRSHPAHLARPGQGAELVARPGSSRCSCGCTGPKPKRWTVVGNRRRR